MTLLFPASYISNNYSLPANVAGLAFKETSGVTFKSLNNGPAERCIENMREDGRSYFVSVPRLDVFVPAACAITVIYSSREFGNELSGLLSSANSVVNSRY